MDRRGRRERRRMVFYLPVIKIDRLFFKNKVDPKPLQFQMRKKVNSMEETKASKESSGIKHKVKLQLTGAFKPCCTLAVDSLPQH